jgi:hypothetical protein
MSLSRRPLMRKRPPQFAFASGIDDPSRRNSIGLPRFAAGVTLGMVSNGAVDSDATTN